MSKRRDMTPALGKRGEPAAWQRAVEGDGVALARPAFGDARSSFLYGRDTRYSGAEPQPGEVAAANRRMRGEAMPADLRGPFLKAPVWTWEVPLYFWFGGVASGSAFVALAADLAGDEWSAAVARKVALGAVLPAPALLIADLGRPARFLNMLRIFKPRSPMNLGAWCLVAFSAVGAGAVGADVLGRRRTARGSVPSTPSSAATWAPTPASCSRPRPCPVWARSRIFLGPIFVATATATGAAATRLTLAAGGQPEDHPTQVALARLGTAAIADRARALLRQRAPPRARGRRALRRRGGAADAHGRGLVVTGLALSLLGRRRDTARGRHATGALYLAGGLAFRIAWVEAGKASARDDEAVALTARDRSTAQARVPGTDRRPAPGGAAGAPLRAWSRTVGRTSLAVERLLRRS